MKKAWKFRVVFLDHGDLPVEVVCHFNPYNENGTLINEDALIDEAGKQVFSHQSEYYPSATITEI